MILIYRDQSQIMIYGSRKVARDMGARRGNHGIRKFRQWIVIGNQNDTGYICCSTGYWSKTMDMNAGTLTTAI
jgi:hypothetical protein